MSENYKDVEISKRKWRITKFDATTGALIIKKILPIAASLFKGVDIGNIKSLKPEDIKMDISGVISALADMKDDDFVFIQKACLRVVSEPLGAGFAPVLNDNGSYGVIGIEHDTMSVLALTAHVLAFNVTGFFDDSPLASIAGGFLSTFLQNSQT